MKKENKFQIRNSTAEFLIFTRQAGKIGTVPNISYYLEQLQLNLSRRA
jgi:hypothetical protein